LRKYFDYVSLSSAEEAPNAFGDAIAINWGLSNLSGMNDKISMTHPRNRIGHTFKTGYA